MPNKENRNKYFLGILKNHKGSIMTLTVVFIIGLAAAAALTLDYKMAVTKRNAINHLSDMMMLAAIDGFHTDEVFINRISQLPARDEVIARIVSGMSNAQNVFLASTNSVARTSELVNPFAGSVDWRSEFRELMDWIENSGPVYTFPANAYEQSSVKFLGENFQPISPITNANNPLDIKAVRVNLEMKPGVSVQPFFLKIFSNRPLRAGASSTAEMINASTTRSVVLAIDRSLSMAHFTGPGPCSGNQCDNYLHWIQLGNYKIEPMQSLLNAAQILPDALAESNRYRPRRLNNSFGVVLFDIFAEAVQFKGANGDIDPYLSHDEDSSGYQDVKNVLTAPLHSQKIPRILPLGDFDITNAACNENHPLGSDSCRHDHPRSLQEFKSYWLSKLNSTGAVPDDLYAVRPLQDGLALDSFFPWTNTDGSVGLEVAIEILRQERHRFVTLENNPSDRFQAEIVFLSDTVMNTFHDRNILQNGRDNFPAMPLSNGTTIQCDQEGFYNSGAQERIVVPAGWRKYITQPKFYGDLYHSGNTRWTIANFNPDNPPAGFEPKGVETNTNDSLVNMVNYAKPCTTANGSERGCCPGPDCMGILSVLQGYVSTTTTINSGTRFSCGDVALMDYARWAEANKIRIHGVGFELAMQSAASQVTGRFMLNFIADPSRDGKDVGLVFYDTNCHPDGTCPELEEAFKKIGRLLDVRLSSK